MKYYIKTFGCQMNQRDSEKVEAMFKERGYKPSNIKEADIVIVNSCAVREKSQQKIFSEIGRLKNLNKKAKFIAMGCVAQIFPDRLSKISDVVVGTSSILNLERVFNEKLKGIFVSDKNEDPDYIFSHIPNVKSYVDITYGCDNFCTYCVVPYTRLREVSRSYNAIISEITHLIEIGTKEVILLGQNVNSYKDGDVNFVKLLEMVNKIDGLKRIRFVTSHPKDFSEDLCKVMADLDKVCEHIHLPIQSGSDRILRLMRRKYTFGDYIKKVEFFRKYNPSGSITSDIIVGFPQETDEDFKQTLLALKEIQFDEIYSFKYSNRPFAKATLMNCQIEEKVKEERLLIVQQMQNEISENINKRYLNATFDILIESKAKKTQQLQGRTKTNKIVNVPNDNSIFLGDIINVKINKINKHSFTGEVCIS